MTRGVTGHAPQPSPGQGPTKRSRPVTASGMKKIINPDDGALPKQNLDAKSDANLASDCVECGRSHRGPRCSRNYQHVHITPTQANGIDSADSRAWNLELFPGGDGWFRRLLCG